MVATSQARTIASYLNVETRRPSRVMCLLVVAICSGASLQSALHRVSLSGVKSLAHAPAGGPTARTFQV